MTHSPLPDDARKRWYIALAAPGLVALAWDPARWLWKTWHAPAYQSDGGLVALATVALIAASCLSGPPVAEVGAARQRIAWMLLALTAALRIVGRLLAVNTIGALALVVDVAAVGTLLGASRRPFALHPALLAGFFALSLPLEHHAQRIIGHPLQLLAAAVSEALLSPFFADLSREGVLLLHPQIALAIDLPCSGARGLVLFTSIALGLWSVHQLSRSCVLRLGIAVALGAMLANVARICALFVGSAWGLPVIGEPWHSLLGAGALALGALPLLTVFRHAPRRRPAVAGLTEPPAGAPQLPEPAASLGLPAALAVSLLGLAAAAAPERPLDVSPVERELYLPTTLGAFHGREIELAPREKLFFEQWGGGAQKRRYDDGGGVAHTALLVRTRSPLRHLHGPDLCLIGSGHRVQRIGVVPGAVPSILFKSTAPDGSEWRVEASFASDAGERASSVSEVVWRWLANPESTWNLVERISPWHACAAQPERCARFDRALFTSLDLPVDSSHANSPESSMSPDERNRT